MPASYSASAASASSSRRRPRPRAEISYDTVRWMRRRRKGKVGGSAHSGGEVFLKTGQLAAQRAYLKRMFSIFDQSGDGSIDLSELRHALLDYGLSRHKADDLLEVFANLPSVQNDGEIDFDEFVSCMGTSSTLSDPRMFYFLEDQISSAEDSGAQKFAAFSANYERLIARRKIDAGSYDAFVDLFGGSYNMRSGVVDSGQQKPLQKGARKRRHKDKKKKRSLRDEDNDDEKEDDGDKDGNTGENAASSGDGGWVWRASSRPGTYESRQHQKTPRTLGKERRRRIAKIIEERGSHCKSTAPRRKGRKARARRLRSLASDRAAQQQASSATATMRSKHQGLMRKEEGRSAATLRLRAAKIASSTMGSKSNLHTRLFGTRSMQAVCALPSITSFSSPSAVSSVVSTTMSASLPPLTWAPPRMTSSNDRRTAHVIGLRRGPWTMQAMTHQAAAAGTRGAVGSGSRLGLSSRGSIVRSRGGVGSSGSSSGSATRQG